MKNSLLALALVVCFLSTNAQTFKFGKVSIEELSETVHPKDPTANAAVLFRNYNVRYHYQKGSGFVQIVEVHERIKIYNKEGFDWATKKVKLYNKTNSTSESLGSLKAHTYNLVDGQIVENKLDRGEIFEEQANEFWKFESFTMPNIKEGSVLEYRYDITSPFIQIDDIDLQYTIPINVEEVSVSTPEFFVYNKMLNPRAKYIPKLNISKQSKTVPITYFENIINIAETDVPALIDEPMVDNIYNYQAKLIMELSMTRFPDSPIETYTTDWEKVTKTIYENSNFGAQLDKNGYYEAELAEALAGVTEPNQKMEKVYDFVKSKVKWNNYYGVYSNYGLRKAYKDGTGNSADINLMLISMLRHAGLNANPVLVSTKNNGIPLFPTRQGFNYVVGAVEVGGKYTLLDATEEFGTLNILPLRAMNWQGRLIKKDGVSDWMPLTPNFSSRDIIALNATITSDFSVEGDVKNQLNNHYALRHRNSFANVNTDEYRKELEKNKGEIEVNNLEIKDIKISNKPVMISYSYKCTDRIEEIGDKLYLSPMLFLANQDNPFKDETREYPIDLNHPFSDKYIINLTLPEGYKVSALPQNERFKFNDQTGDYTYLIKDMGKSIQLTVDFNFNSPLILAGEYKDFKNFYNLIINKQEEKVVLEKI